MKAFWWFKENSIAGMARPGFNAIRWLELSFDESVLLGWIGQFSESSSQSQDDFHQHVLSYAPKIGKFHGVVEENFFHATRCFYSDNGLNETLERLLKRTEIFSYVSASQGRIHFEFNQKRLNSEIEFLKAQKINTIVTLTEKHHSQEILQSHFDLYHFSIEDLNAPRIEQAMGFADIIKKSHGKRLAVHCLAGIGRTSTMLMTAHMALGESQHELEALLKRQNTSFALSPPQREFVKLVTQHLVETPL